MDSEEELELAIVFHSQSQSLLLGEDNDVNSPSISYNSNDLREVSLWGVNFTSALGDIVRLLLNWTFMVTVTNFLIFTKDRSVEWPPSLQPTSLRSQGESGSLIKLHFHPPPTPLSLSLLASSKPIFVIFWNGSYWEQNQEIV